MLRRVSGILFILGGAACSIGALDGFSGTPAPDAGGADGSATSDATVTLTDGTSGNSDVVVIADAGDDSSTAGNLVTNGGFEQGNAGCGPGWRADRTTMTRSPSAHTGAYSCLVCLVPGNTIGNVFPLNNNLGTAKVGENYFGEAWVAAPPSGPTSEMSLQLTVNDVNLGFSSAVPQPTWQVVQVQGAVQADGILDLALRWKPPAGGGTDGCYLVDDVVVVRQ